MCGLIWVWFANTNATQWRSSEACQNANCNRMPPQMSSCSHNHMVSLQYLQHLFNCPAKLTLEDLWLKLITVADWLASHNPQHILLLQQQYRNYHQTCSRNVIGTCRLLGANILVKVAVTEITLLSAYVGRQRFDCVFICALCILNSLS